MPSCFHSGLFTPLKYPINFLTQPFRLSSLEGDELFDTLFSVRLVGSNRPPIVSFSYSPVNTNVNSLSSGSHTVLFQESGYLYFFYF